MDLMKKGMPKRFQEGGAARIARDPRFTPQLQTFKEADAILDIARRRKPSGVIGQDDINAAKEEYNRRKELQRMRQAETDPIPMPKTSKRSLVNPMGPSRRAAMDPAAENESKFIQRRDVFTSGADPMRRLGPGMPGMKEGGSVSSKPKHRGWGKAIKGTIFKGTR